MLPLKLYCLFSLERRLPIKLKILQWLCPLTLRLKEKMIWCTCGTVSECVCVEIKFFLLTPSYATTLFSLMLGDQKGLYGKYGHRAVPSIKQALQEFKNSNFEEEDE